MPPRWPKPSSKLSMRSKRLSNSSQPKIQMRILHAVIAMTSLPAAAASAGTINFDDAKPGEAPPGWTATKTGKGEAKWTIEKDDTAPSKPNVLKQSGEATYPVCLKSDTSVKDGFVEVKFKP